MNVVVSTEQRFDRTPDSVVWTQTACAYPFWTRYLAVFDRVRVVARVRDVPAVPPDWQRADGDAVCFAPVPHYLGPRQYVLRAAQVGRAAREAISPYDAIILRLPSTIAGTLIPLLRHTGHPYGVEVVGDPYDVFAHGAVRHPLRPFLRWWSPRLLRRQCAGACAAAYVTERALQQRYPAAGVRSTSYSDVELPAAAFVPAPRPPRSGGPYTLVTVGTLAQLYKAPDVLIDAVAALVQDGLDLRLVLVGDGRHRQELEVRAAAQGIAERVVFRGQLTAGPAVRGQVDQGDVFILPSRQEGLPRAMIEAMARALPCIGSQVGGIPELLPPEDLVPPGDVAALAQKIRAVVTDPARMARMSAHNLERARAYREEALEERRVEFYHYVRARTAAWLQTRRSR